MTPLTGGGKAYDYGAYTQFLPPPHFNVLKASDRQLREYGLPTRQKFGSRWCGLMRHMRHFVKPTPYLVEIPAAHKTAPRASDLSACPNCSYNWAGYAAIAGHAYNGVGAGWYEPSFVSDPCSTTDFVQWVGIGDYSDSGDLGQDGTAFGVPNVGSHQAWIETIANGSGPLTAVNLYATKGKKFTAVTNWDSSATKYDYMMGDDATGDVWDGQSRSVGSDNDLSSAEVIAERTTGGSGNGGDYDLTDFQSFQVTDPGVDWGSTGSSSFYNLPSSDETSVVMADSPNYANVMAFPSGLDPSTSDFTNTWNHCN